MHLAGPPSAARIPNHPNSVKHPCSDARKPKSRFLGTLIKIAAVSMSVCFSRPSTRNAERVARMRTLISSDHCRLVMQGSSWTLLDRLLYRGMRALLFNRDLELLRQSAKRALRRDLDRGGDLRQSPMVYLRVERLIWSLRWKSTAFAFGFDVDARPGLDLLLAAT